MNTKFTISTNRFCQEFLHEGKTLFLTSFIFKNSTWIFHSHPSPLFAVEINGQRFESSDLEFHQIHFNNSIPGIQQITLIFNGPGFAVDHHLKVYEDSSLLEMFPTIRCIGSQVCTISRIDSYSLLLPSTNYRLNGFRGDWGSEFEPIQTTLTHPFVLESRSGRSSKGNHPWFALIDPTGMVLTGSVVWSGNWVARFNPLPNGTLSISGGLHDWGFTKELAPGEKMEAPSVILVLEKDLDAASRQFARIGRRFWYPRNQLSAKLPVEWNHWWPYEDADINEKVFEKNILEAAKHGVEVCTLDAGWFGPSQAGTFWYEYRGDWHLVNDQRFPSGIRALSDKVHAAGMSFGLWCEIEGLGINAQLAKDRPDYVALRDGQRLGYVCFGNPAVQEWAYQTLCRLIEEYNCDWIKLDFNLDPGAGCNRSDHGHGTGDGLYEHYKGYYRTLERVRKTHPEVVLENCSSGGLRIDLAILRHTDMTYLSDPDYPVHDLQIFWGATQMIAPNVCLHWSYGQWRGDDKPPQQKFNPRDPNLTQHQFDYYTRISMLNWYGFSQKLPELPPWVSQRLKYHTDIYKKFVRRFVNEADLYHLTGQPRRSGEGERWCAFQYSLPDQSEHLLFVFRLPGGEGQRYIRMKDLQQDRLYTIEDFDGIYHTQKTGKDLMETGIPFSHLEEEGSELLRIR